MSRMMKMLVAVVVALMLGGAGTAYAHSLGYDSVNANENVIWKKNTVYDGVVIEAVQNWNRLDSRYNGRAVRYIEKSGQTSDTTVFIRSYRSADGRNGFYNTGCNPDCIWLNTYYLENYTAAKREGTATHELGHAGRLAHTPETSHYRENSVMYPVGGNSGRITNPGNHDANDVYGIWVQR